MHGKEVSVGEETLALSLIGPALSQIDVEIAAATHRGHISNRNADHYLAVRFNRSLETLFTNAEEEILELGFEETGYGMLVADGIGGMAAGETVSGMVLGKLMELVDNTPDWVMRVNQREDMTIVMQRMTQRFRQIDSALRKQAAKDSTLRGMRTTLTVAASLGANLVIGHIGDSRAYLLRGTTLHQLTSDHTLAQAMIDAGIVNPEDPATHTVGHVLTAALGSSGAPSDPQVQRLHLRAGDQVLLCTDGLTEMVTDESIASVMSSAGSSEDACRTLIDLALSAGGLDNVTVVLARYRFRG